MKIVIAGGDGFLGRGLAKRWLTQGGEVVVLSRSAAPADLPARMQWCRWDGKTLEGLGSDASGNACGGSFGGSCEGSYEGPCGVSCGVSSGGWCRALVGAKAVVNVVGRTVDCRKTALNVREIYASRLDSVAAIGRALQGLKERGEPLPGVWIQAGTAHIYGDPLPEDTLVNDGGPIGEGLAPQVGVAWERAFAQALPAGMRGVVLRTSFVLGRDGGALPKMARLARWGLGGRIGSGKQWISWIHEDDFHHLVMAMIHEPAYAGVYNVTAPNPVTNAAFMRALRRACRRPWSPPAPAWGVRMVSRWVMNTDPELALLGRRVVPSRLLSEKRFVYQWPDVGPALRDLL